MPEPKLLAWGKVGTIPKLVIYYTWHWRFGCFRTTRRYPVLEEHAIKMLHRASSCGMAGFVKPKQGFVRIYPEQLTGLKQLIGRERFPVSMTQMVNSILAERINAEAKSNNKRK